MRSTALRSRPAILLIAATLLVCLLLGAAFIALHRLKDSRGEAAQPPKSPLTDDESMKQVLAPARQVVAAGPLRKVSGTYVLASCDPEEGPPYQGTAYVSFDVPNITETTAYFRDISRRMAARGWAEGLKPNSYPGGRLLTKDGVTVVFYRNPDVPGRGVLEVFGECRNVADHSADTTGFVDITGELAGTVN